MSRSTLLFIFFLTILTVFLGYNYFVQPFKDIFNPPPAAQIDNEQAEGTSAADRIFNQLSTTDKVWQVMALPYTVSASPSASVRQVATYNPGFITLFGDKISTNSALMVQSEINAVENQRLPIWVAVDHEGGSVQRLSGTGFTRVPSWQELCQLDADKRSIILNKTAAELRAAGVKVVFAPTVDSASSSAIMGNRLCSGDATIVTAASQQFLDIFTRQKIMPVLKHFPGIGKVTRDLHTSFDRITVTEQEALIYKHLLTQFPFIGVMTSHVGVTNQYPDVPCSLSTACVGELGTNFADTLVFTDALDMRAALYVPTRSEKTLANVSAEALRAGNHVLVYGRGVSTPELEMIVNDISAQASTDSGLLNKIDIAARKIIEYKLSATYE